MLSATPISGSADQSGWEPKTPVIPDTEAAPIMAELPARTQVSGIGCEKRKTRRSPRSGRAPSPCPGTETSDSRPTARADRREKPESIERRREDTPLTRALRSHQLWLTLTYFALLILMARGLAG
jgi:lipoprotein-anchoring transpeptidase ErfK/SrfK